MPFEVHRETQIWSLASQIALTPPDRAEVKWLNLPCGHCRQNFWRPVGVSLAGMEFFDEISLTILLLLRSQLLYVSGLSRTISSPLRHGRRCLMSVTPLQFTPILPRPIRVTHGNRFST